MSTAVKRSRFPRYPATKAEVWDKTNGKCWYCRKELHPFWDFTIDHVIPLTKGGPDTIENMVPSCRPCNSSKGVGQVPSNNPSVLLKQKLDPFAALVAYRLSYARNKADFRRSDVAQALGVRPSTIYNWERGNSKYKGLGPAELRTLAELYGVSIAWLVGQEPLFDEEETA